MKRNFLLSWWIIIALFTSLNAQTYIGNLTLRTQSEIDDFNYSSVTGNLRITEMTSGNITNLNGLSELTTIGGDLSITQNRQLTTLNGLNNLTSIGGDLDIGGDVYNIVALSNLNSISGDLGISHNRALTNLNGLEGITSVLTFSLHSCSELTSIQALSNLSSVENISINGSSNLSDFSGLEGITSVSGYIRISGNSITSLNGLNNLSSIGGELSISNTDLLVSLDALSNLTSIGTDLTLNFNDVITNLNGFSNLSYIGGDLEIRRNPSLSYFCGIYNLLNTDGLEGNFLVSENAVNPTIQELIDCGSCEGINPPNANAGGDILALVNGIVYLDGSNSSDPDNDLLSFNWSIITKPQGSNAELSDSTNASPAFIADISGEYAIRLIVSDGCVNSEPDYILITALTIEEALEDPKDIVQNFPLNSGNKNALTSKLDNAIDKYNAGDFIAAKNILNAFLNQLNQFVTDGLISLAEAQPLIDYVNQIIAAINS
ncbi:MAG: hypothetical protein R6W68_07570, partial [Ignavibacteriaceae bacterium]